MEEGEEQAAQETESVTIEVPDHPGSPPQPAENVAGSSQGSRPSTAEEQRQQQPSPANQLAVPRGQSRLMDIGIDEVRVIISISNLLIQVDCFAVWQIRLLFTKRRNYLLYT